MKNKSSFCVYVCVKHFEKNENEKNETENRRLKKTIPFFVHDVDFYYCGVAAERYAVGASVYTVSK